MRAVVQFPLTEPQQREFDHWVERLVWNYVPDGQYELTPLESGDYLERRFARVDVSDAVLREPSDTQFAWNYWATDGVRDRYHFCQYPTLNQGWYGCMKCWTD